MINVTWVTFNWIRLNYDGNGSSTVFVCEDARQCASDSNPSDGAIERRRRRWRGRRRRRRRRCRRWRRGGRRAVERAASVDPFALASAAVDGRGFGDFCDADDADDADARPPGARPAQGQLIGWTLNLGLWPFSVVQSVFSLVGVIVGCCVHSSRALWLVGWFRRLIESISLVALDWFCFFVF